MNCFRHIKLVLITPVTLSSSREINALKVDLTLVQRFEWQRIHRKNLGEVPAVCWPYAIKR